MSRNPCKPGCTCRKHLGLKRKYATKSERYRAGNLKAWHNITVEQYMEMFNSQGGRCAICGRTSEKNLFVDHDHSCCPGKTSCGNCIRGLLCADCNFMLGHAKDDPTILEAGIRYLESSRVNE